MNSIALTIADAEELGSGEFLCTLRPVEEDVLADDILLRINRSEYREVRSGTFELRYLPPGARTIKVGKGKPREKEITLLPAESTKPPAGGKKFAKKSPAAAPAKASRKSAKKTAEPRIVVESAHTIENRQPPEIPDARIGPPVPGAQPLAMNIRPPQQRFA